MIQWFGKWTPELEAEVARLWGEGETALGIAAAIGAPTRSIVLGKLGRLGLLGTRNGPSPLKGTHRTDPPIPPPPIEAPVVTVPDEVQEQPAPALAAPMAPSYPRRAPITELASSQCRFAVDEVDGIHLFCGEPRAVPHRYCAAHALRVFTFEQAGGQAEKRRLMALADGDAMRQAAE